MNKILGLVFAAFILFTMQACDKDQVKNIGVESLSFDKKTLTIEEGDILTLEANILPENASDLNLIWSSDKPEIATISEKGVLTAVSVGEVTIKVEHIGGMSAVCSIIIIKKENEYLKKFKTSEFGWKSVYAGTNSSFGAYHYIFNFTAENVNIKTNYLLVSDNLDCDYTLEGNRIVFGGDSPFKKYFNSDLSDKDNVKLDCSFIIEEMNETTIKLVGETFNTVLILEKAEANDAELFDVYVDQSAKLVAFGESNTDEKFFKILKLTGAVEKLIEVDFGAWLYTNDYCTMSVQYVQDDKIVSDTIQYYYTEKGFNLYKPYLVGGKEISTFEYDELSKSFKLAEANGVEGAFSFSDERAYPRVGLGAEFISKSHQIIGMANSTLAMNVMKDGAHCNFMMGNEVGIFIDYEKEGEIINSIMLSNNEEGILAIDMKWSIVGEDLLVGEFIDQSVYDALTAAEKLMVDYFVNGFYILPYNPILGYDTYLLVGKTNSSMALGAFMVDTKTK